MTIADGRGLNPMNGAANIKKKLAPLRIGGRDRFARRPVDGHLGSSRNFTAAFDSSVSMRRYWHRPPFLFIKMIS
jgi:hypothetical protein